MAALRAVRELGLQSWCIGAGMVRALVWDHLHGYGQPSPVQDIDVVYFDPNDLSVSQERRHEARLHELAPDVAWEVVNQAAVHRWLRHSGASDAAPFASLDEGIASWPEYATCVGVCLTPENRIEVIAPHGLDDLFSMVLRWNPTRVSQSVFHQRYASKQFQARWPQVRVAACPPVVPGL